MATPHDDELQPEQTAGFKVGEKKTIDEYQKLGVQSSEQNKPRDRIDLHTDQNDESLRKWKESLGLGTGESISDPSDPRKVIIMSLGLEVSSWCCCAEYSKLGPDLLLRWKVGRTSSSI